MLTGSEVAQSTITFGYSKNLYQFGSQFEKSFRTVSMTNKRFGNNLIQLDVPERIQKSSGIIGSVQSTWFNYFSAILRQKYTFFVVKTVSTKMD